VWPHMRYAFRSHLCPREYTAAHMAVGPRSEIPLSDPHRPTHSHTAPPPIYTAIWFKRRSRHSAQVNESRGSASAALGRLFPSPEPGVRRGWRFLFAVTCNGLVYRVRPAMPAARRPASHRNRNRPARKRGWAVLGLGRGGRGGGVLAVRAQNLSRRKQQSPSAGRCAFFFAFRCPPPPARSPADGRCWCCSCKPLPVGAFGAAPLAPVRQTASNAHQPSTTSAH
jgi:hypothetical protein